MLSRMLTTGSVKMVSYTRVLWKKKKLFSVMFIVAWLLNMQHAFSNPRMDLRRQSKHAATHTCKSQIKLAMVPNKLQYTESGSLTPYTDPAVQAIGRVATREQCFDHV